MLSASMAASSAEVDEKHLHCVQTYYESMNLPFERKATKYRWWKVWRNIQKHAVLNSRNLN